MLANYDARRPVSGVEKPHDLTTAQAYALQAEIARLREERGERIIGYKIGCTSRAIQQQLGVDEPIYGRIFDTGRVASGARLSHANYANLAVEGELAVQMASDLTGASLPDDECRDAIGAVFPVIELHDYVLCSPQTCGQELIATNGMHAGFVVPAQPSGRPTLHVTGVTLHINHERRAHTDAPWTMGDPMTSLRWLAARLGERGLRLSRGQTILTGSPLPLCAVTPGTLIAVEAPPLERIYVDIDP